MSSSTWPTFTFYNKNTYLADWLLFSRTSTVSPEVGAKKLGIQAEKSGKKGTGARLARFPGCQVVRLARLGSEAGLARGLRLAQN